jgi:HK97 family phage prohead protease
MAHLFKSFEMKAADNGLIEGYFSTYEKTPDSYGDIIEPGAFTETIKAREETGHPFPLCFNHDFSAVIGAVDSVKDTEKGPFISAHFLDTQLAQDVRKMLQSGAIYQFSFAYDTLKRRDPNDEERKNGVMNVLEELEVYEVSVVTVPANQNAQVTDIKSAIETAVKAGRRNSKSDEDTIKECIAMLQSLIEDRVDDIPEEEEPDEEVAPEANEASEEPKAVDNSKRTSDLLEKIKSMKEVPEDES